MHIDAGQANEAAVFVVSGTYRPIAAHRTAIGNDRNAAIAVLGW
jgi:hypothetical protein